MQVENFSKTRQLLRCIKKNINIDLYIKKLTIYIYSTNTYKVRNLKNKKTRITA